MNDYRVPRSGGISPGPGPGPAGTPFDKSTEGHGGATSHSPRTISALPGKGWTFASPGTGGNIQSLALTSGDSDTIWVGSDNAGMMRGKRSLLWWSFDGAHRGIESPDIGDITTVDLATGTLVYALAGGGLGPGGPRERQGLYLKKPGTDKWTPVLLDEFDHVWLDVDNGPPTTGSWSVLGGKESPEWYRTETVRFLPPSLVRAFALPGTDGRHLLVVGGNNGSRQYSGSTINLPVNAPATDRSYVVGQSTITPHENPPTFHLCLAQWKDGVFKRGNWVGATYVESRAVWPTATGPDPQPLKNARYINYDRRSGVGSMWLDPQLRTTTAGTEVRVYFTVRFEPVTPDSPVDPGSEQEEEQREYHLARLTVVIPKGTTLTLPVPESESSQSPFHFDRILSVDATTGMGQVAGFRQNGLLHLIYTAPLAATAVCIRRLDETSVESGEFGPPQTENIDAELVKYYGAKPVPKDGRPAPSEDVPTTYGAVKVGTFFLAETSPLGWSYVAACKGSAGGINPGLWRRDPKNGTWTRATFLMGDAPGPARSMSLKLATGHAGLTPIQVAIGVVVERPFEATPIDSQRLLVVVRFFHGSLSVGPSQTVHLDPFTDGERVAEVLWSFIQVGTSPNVELGTDRGIEVQLTCRAARGAAAVQILARLDPVASGSTGAAPKESRGAGCPLEAPQSWKNRLSGWKASPTTSDWIPWMVLGDAPTISIDVDKASTTGSPSVIEPNMHGSNTWRSNRVTGQDNFECLAVAPGPSAKPDGSDQRIVVGRGDSQVFYSSDNGESFAPLGCIRVSDALVGSSDDETEDLVPLWATTGLETMWMQGFYVAKLLAEGLTGTSAKCGQRI